MDYGLYFYRSSTRVLATFFDADWAGCPNDCGNTRVFVYFLVPISLARTPATNLPLPVQAQRRNTRQLRMQLVSTVGSVSSSGP